MIIIAKILAYYWPMVIKSYCLDDLKQKIREVLLGNKEAYFVSEKKKNKFEVMFQTPEVKEVCLRRNSSHLWISLRATSSR